MAPREERHLLVVRRRVAATEEAEYQRLWAALSATVTAAGSHAWRFRSPSDRTERLEFLEFESGRDPRTEAESEPLLARLDREIGPATIVEWLEDR